MVVQCGWACRASDYVLVVDTSGSMTGPISRGDSRVRIKVVQAALRDFFGRLPLNSRVYLFSFNTGITSQSEVYLTDDTRRQDIFRWIDGLEAEARKEGSTHLCSTLRKALQKAVEYSTEHPSQPVTLWALTDGGDNEPGPGTESGAPKRLNNVLAEFPQIDEDSIRASLTILGDLALTMTSEKKWFRIRTDAKFENIVPPVIEWSPDCPKAGETVTFLENSQSPYQFYEWRIDGKPAGSTKATKATFPSEGTHDVRLTVTAANGDKLTDNKRISMLPAIAPEKPAADFVVIPGHPEPGQKVELIGRPKGKGLRYSWSVAGRTVATQEVAETTFPEEGQFEVRFRVENQTGLSDEKALTVSVTEQPIAVRFVADAEAQSGQKVRFVNETTGGTAAEYEWDFGDGAKSSETNSNHAFIVLGTNSQEFPVVLRATSRTGKVFTSDSFRLKIWPLAPKPKAAFRATANHVRLGAMVQFLNDSTGPIERTAWAFGNEGSSTKTSPEFAFGSPGEKLVVLTVTGPGGSDSATNWVEVQKPEVSIAVKWIDQQGQNAAPPSEIDYGQVPPAHAKSGEYPRPPFDSFDVILPADLAPDAELDISIGERAGKGLELVRCLPNSDRLAPVDGPLRESGRYRIRVRPDSSEGKFSDTAVFRVRGKEVLLNGAAASIQFPLKLQIGTSGGGFPGLFILNPPPPVDPRQRMEVVLREMSLGSDGKPLPTQSTPEKQVVLSLNNRIYLGETPALAPAENIFNLGSPRSFLMRQQLGLMLHRSSGGKDELIRRSAQFSLVDEQGKTRVAKLTMRPAPQTKPGASRTLKQ